ncbi:MAG: alcohol dehydrogenase catalytic domain-containing protein [Anaerolineae bacterium]|jgi:threonine dehydrogenase-like Zn-dependent dehydrogenase
MQTIYFEMNIPKALVTKALRPVWPGVVWTPLSPSRFATLPDPPLPGPRWIRLRNRQCGICATDLTLLQVEADPQVSMAALPSLARFYLGHEVVSDVVETGPQVATLQVGDRVIMDTPHTGPTCFSQEIAPPCPHCSAGNHARCENQAKGASPTAIGGGWGDSYIAHETEVFKIPTDLTDDQAVLTEPASVALRAVLRARPGPGQRVLVIGCGIIGLLTVRLTRIVEPQAHITAMARYPHQVDMARRLGADDVLAGGDQFAEVARLTGGQLHTGALGNQMLLGGYDVIYDIVGSGRTIKDGLRWARAGATVVVVGISPKLVKTDLSPIWHQEVTLTGTVVHGIEQWQGQPVHGYDLVMRWMREGILLTDGLITHRFPLADYKEAVATATDKRTGAIKVLFQMQPG